LDIISTNVTGFFREPDHFDFLAEAVSGWLSGGQRRFRFWSAACSSGEEPYSMALVLLDVTSGYDVDVKILATDISTRVLQRALAGVYEKEQLSPVPGRLRKRYFRRVTGYDHGGEYYRVTPEVSGMCLFRRYSLSQFPYPLRGPLDMIFCRNTMIYFDTDLRRGMVAEFRRLLRSGGYLVVGHSESLSGLDTGLRCIRPSVYLKD